MYVHLLSILCIYKKIYVYIFIVLLHPPLEAFNRKTKLRQAIQQLCHRGRSKPPSTRLLARACQTFVIYRTYFWGDIPASYVSLPEGMYQFMWTGLLVGFFGGMQFYPVNCGPRWMCFLENAMFMFSGEKFTKGSTNWVVVSEIFFDVHLWRRFPF